VQLRFAQQTPTDVLLVKEIVNAMIIYNN